MPSGRIPENVMTRFERHYIPEPNTGCWLWLGGLNKQGYGKFHTHKTEFAHRASWQLHNGVLAQQTHVLHKCDTPGCVNPDHLFIGTHADNMRDKAEKGRQFRPCGARNGHAKLSTGDVLRIRELRSGGASIAELCSAFSLSQPSMSALLAGKTYADV